MVSYLICATPDVHPSKTNDQGDISAKYSHKLGSVDLSGYLELMNEDSNPFYHSGSSHLFGLTGWVPIGQTRVRITAEFTDSVPTTDIFNFGRLFLRIFVQRLQVPGWDAQTETVPWASSLDDDSKLATLQASWLGAHKTTWTVTYHHAVINAAIPVGGSLYIIPPSGFHRCCQLCLERAGVNEHRRSPGCISIYGQFLHRRRRSLCDRSTASRSRLAGGGRIAAQILALMPLTAAVE